MEILGANCVSKGSWQTIKKHVEPKGEFTATDSRSLITKCR